MKFSIYLFILINFINLVLAQQMNSNDLLIRRKILHAGWLKCYEEQKLPNNEIIKGAINIYKSLRFYGTKKFEMRVFYDNSPLFADYREINFGSCVRNDGFEVSILSGIWKVRRDTIYLTFQHEFIYENDTCFSKTDSRKWDPDLKSRKTPIHACKLTRFEKYTLKENQLISLDKDLPNFK